MEYVLGILLYYIGGKFCYYIKHCIENYTNIIGTILKINDTKNSPCSSEASEEDRAHSYFSILIFKKN